MADSWERENRQAGPGDSLFTPKASPRDEMPVNAWAIAALVVLVAVSLVLVFTRHQPAAANNTFLPADPYAVNLPISGLAMSESTSLSGGKSTFIDGHIRNTGSATLSAITVQVLFRNDEALPPRIDTLPLTLIRAREPYIDTEPVSHAPLKTGDERDFRLIFENVPAKWNGQLPEIHIVRVNSSVRNAMTKYFLPRAVGSRLRF